MHDIKKKSVLTNKAAQLALLQTQLKKQASEQLSKADMQKGISGDTVAGIGIAILFALLFFHILF